MNLAKLIDKNLDKFLPSAKTEPRILHEAMRYGVFPGGKRIRPIILIEAAIACGGNYREAAAAGCAVEFVHAYSLIHDDLPSMDDDDYRRGRPSCHKKFGEANAILAGDALLTLAFDLLANGYAPWIGIKMIKELSAATGSEGMVGGQALDIAGNKNSDKVSRLKTAKLFEASAALGALSTRAGKKKIATMRKYGLNLGMAFQAIDDILDGENIHLRKDAGISIDKAKDALAVLGRPRAERLKKIADTILTRSK